MLQVVAICLAIAGMSCGGVKTLPSIDLYKGQVSERVEIGPQNYVMDEGWLQKNGYGLWELYLEGDALERGLANGMLTQELLYHQEGAFVSKIRQLVPSTARQRLLRGFLKFFNRRLSDHVTEEYQVEIYGLSRSSTDEYNFIAPPYQRLLYFHGAHDMGHALKDLALVGCTSFAAWGTQTKDRKLLIGRNFDFYAGDAFSEEKIVAFIKPDMGYNYAMVTWAGMVGAVSGMNEHGLTVTINAGKSSMPWKAKTPISLVTKEILQYAANIEEAIGIAERREVFVSESILVGSAADGKAVLIEVSPKRFGVYEVGNDEDLIVCSNHFQSQPYKSDKNNLRHIAESHSQYRFDRMAELIGSESPLTPNLAATLLRDKEGLGGVELGYGNEMAINQLLAHHSVIFQPDNRLMWVSSSPYQLGAFVAYDLNEVFGQSRISMGDTLIANGDLMIPSDDFIHAVSFRNYQEYRELMREMQAKTSAKIKISEAAIKYFEGLNIDFWKTHFAIGEYYFSQRQYAAALSYYHTAGDKVVTTESDKKLIEKRIRTCERKIK